MRPQALPTPRELVAPDPVGELFASIQTQWNRFGAAQDDAALEQEERRSLELQEQGRLWREGLTPFSPRPSETRKRYVQQLWRLLGQLRQQAAHEAPLRRMASYRLALLLWCRLRSVTEQTHPELIRLAEGLAQVAPTAATFHQMPVLGWTLGVLLEAQCVALSGLSPAVGEAMACLLDRLRIDWSTPQSELASRLDGISRLLPLFQGVRHSWAAQLSLWRAVGLWRSDAAVARSELIPQVKSLAEDHRITTEQAVVCRWCLARLQFEAAGSDQADIQPQQWKIVRKTLAEWQALEVSTSTTDETQTLGFLFRALWVAELVSGLRAVEFPLQPAVASRLRELLQLRPKILDRYPVLDRHIQPVLERFRESGA